MAIRIALFGIPPVAVIGLVFLLNGLNASAGVAFTAFTVVAVAIGAAIGYFVDRMPGARTGRTPIPLRVATATEATSYLLPCRRRGLGPPTRGL
jgi:hypothetical protein